MQRTRRNSRWRRSLTTFADLALKGSLCRRRGEDWLKGSVRGGWSAEWAEGEGVGMEGRGLFKGVPLGQVDSL